MNKYLPTTIAMCLLLALGQVYAKPPGKEKPPGGAVDGTYYAEVSGVWNSTLWTIPGEKNPAGSVNFGGTAILDMDVLTAHFGAEDAAKCFGGITGRGLQIYDANFSGNDAGVIARTWFKANTKSGKLVQYVISFSTSIMPWLQDDEWGDVGNFHPALGDTIYRSADSWSIGATKSAKDACRTDGDVPPLEGSDRVLEIYLSQVAACEYPYDEVSCD